MYINTISEQLWPPKKNIVKKYYKAHPESEKNAQEFKKMQNNPVNG